jgi:toxin YoeB
VKLIWATEAWQDYLSWQENDKRTVGKINDLIKEIRRTPFTGKGKPEPLRHTLSGLWARRITLEHRLLYTVTDEAILIVACRYHY